MSPESDNKEVNGGIEAKCNKKVAKLEKRSKSTNR